MSQKMFKFHSINTLCNKETDILTDQESGEVICTNCGNVLSKGQETKAEWNTFNSGDKNSKVRTGAPHP